MSDFGPLTNVEWNAGGVTGIARPGSDKNLLVMFYNKSVENPVKSREMGRRICEDRVYIMIQHPGEHLNKIDRPVQDEDKARFRDKWSAFIQNRTQIPEGTPIDLLFPNHPSVAENLRATGVYTIEQCAGLSAHAIDNIGRGGQEYVNRAQKYLESANKGVAFHAQQKEIDDLKQELRTANHTIKMLQQQMDQVMMRQNDPLKMSQVPPFIPNYDAQSERINANHPTKEVVEKKKRGRPVKVESKPQTLEDRVTDPFNSMNNPDIMGTQGQDAEN